MRRITGISGDDLAAASTTAEAWSKLIAVAGDIARCGRRKTCPTVIHFARFTENIRTLGELKDWLLQTRTSARSGRVYPMDPGRRLGLPDKPGIYRMLRSNGDVLYVGKALSLRRRVNSYFQKRTRHAEHIL